MRTNKGLVLHAKKALAEKWGYVWGTFGQLLTPSLLSQKVNQYPDGVGNYLTFIKANWLGRKTSDCVGLIKGYYWGEGKYDGSSDVSANTMFYTAKEKGVIATIPNIEGICVWKDGHIGVYIGNGQVIEAHGTKYGVIQTPLKGGTEWTHWLKCPYIVYETQPVATPKVPQYVTVTADVLNVRSTPVVSPTNKIGKLVKGDRVKVCKLTGDWYDIYYGTHGGYIHKNYVK